MPLTTDKKVYFILYTDNKRSQTQKFATDTIWPNFELTTDKQVELEVELTTNIRPPPYLPCTKYLEAHGVLSLNKVSNFSVYGIFLAVLE